MSKKEAPSSSSSSPGPLITELNLNDVLLGRGQGALHFLGNQRYREVIDSRRAEYTSSPNKFKHKIATEIVQHIQSLGGRFLKQEPSDEPINDIVREGVWTTVEDPVAIEKCKQALREGNKRPISAMLPGEQTMSALAAAGLSNSTHILPPSILSGTAIPYAADAPLSLFQHGNPFAVQLPVTMSYPMAAANPMHHAFPFAQNSVGARSDLSAYAAAAARIPPGVLQHHRYPSTNVASTAAVRNVQITERPLPSRSSGDASVGSENVVSQRQGSSADRKLGAASSYSNAGSTTTEASTADDLDLTQEDLDLLISALDDRPKFTKEEEEIERASLTDDERVSALTDLFGRLCNVSQSKRAKRDLDQKSIDFLIQQMRLEIERIPPKKKGALVEAKSKCHADEFSNDRLERFLRCEGVNTKLAAQRFVRYWDSRREVFGPEKFSLRMTLSEALHDDVVALETCICQLLPRWDAFGRQILEWDPSRHTKRGYTSESMLRAMWYVMEVASRENNHISSGVVYVIYDRKRSVRNYDRKVMDGATEFDRKCWPVKLISFHACCPPSWAIHIIRPVMFAMMDKRTRSRTQIHDVPTNQIVAVLSNYGIRREMLPKDMGGTVEFDQSEWIANRRALELEEI